MRGMKHFEKDYGYHALSHLEEGEEYNNRHHSTLPREKISIVEREKHQDIGLFNGSVYDGAYSIHVTIPPEKLEFVKEDRKGTDYMEWFETTLRYNCINNIIEHEFL